MRDFNTEYFRNLPPLPVGKRYGRHIHIMPGCPHPADEQVLRDSMELTKFLIKRDGGKVVGERIYEDGDKLCYEVLRE